MSRVPAQTDPATPFRWDLVTPDHLGTLLDGVAAPGLGFADRLVACAGKVIARSGDGDLHFVGRSLDSMFDLLGGALDDTPWRTRLHRLPVSFGGTGRLHPGHHRRFRQILTGFGLTPRSLTRRRRPVTFVDIVSSGFTFSMLYSLLRDWIEQEREPWAVARRKLRFVGVTMRRPTSPNTFRWKQDEHWTRDLPARSVLNVSLDAGLWLYLAGSQAKLTRTFRPDAWFAEADGPARGGDVPGALAEAVALVEYGRRPGTRKALAAAMAAEPAIAEPWLRTLITQLG
jgi:hypothetical protein